MIYYKIKYLFLKSTLAKLRYKVKFIDTNKRKELELKVLIVMREEYDKIKENHDINDFPLMYSLQLDTNIFLSFSTIINLSN